MSTQIEKFLGASAALANRNNLPAGRGLTRQNFGGNIRKIVLGRMLAQVAIVPMAVDSVSLIGHNGDERMLNAVRGRTENGVLKLEGEIPFKPGSARNPFGPNVFIGGGAIIMSGSYSTFSSGSGGTTIILDGREVDLDRAIRLVLVVPSTGVDVKIGGLIGAIGITDHLAGELDFSPSVRVDLVANSVDSLIGDLSGSSKASVTSITGSADLEVSGSGTFTIGEVSGDVNVKVSGSGDVTVSKGRSRNFRGSISGSGSIAHYGTIIGNARLRVSGSGSATAREVLGEADQSVSGSGRATVNGKTYRPRHSW